LPNLDALTTVQLKTPPKRHRAVPVFATLILALVLGMVYYVSIQRKGTQNAYTPPASAATTVNAVPEVKPTPEAQPTETIRPEAVEEEAKSAPKSVTTPAVKKPTAKATSIQTKTTSETKKEDSKVGSILKKTGRILKKPFKF
jgi:cytoskeletal protein RodZ